MTETDQPRPDLDAAIDAVLPSLSAVSDDAAATSLRRTRVALADRAGSRRVSVWGWGLAAMATAGVILLVSVSLFLRRPTPADQVATTARPTALATAASPVPLAPRPMAPTAPRRVASARSAVPRPDRRSRPVRATSAPPIDEAPRPDPLVALVRAVQQIPEDAWQASVARGDAPLPMPDVSLDPIVIVPLDTPSLGDQTAEPLAPGEP